MTSNRKRLSSADDQPPIARTTAPPLYEIVKRRISEAILIGTWPPGTALPSEIALAQMLGVAVGTVRRALSDLTAEGMVSRRRKTGTVVTGHSPNHSLSNFFQYFRLHRLDGSVQKSTARVIRVSRALADEHISGKLDLRKASDVISIERIRAIDEVPVMHDVIVLSADRVPHFPMSPADVPALIYAWLLEQYGIRIATVREALRALPATPADCERLALTPPAAILQIEEVCFDKSNVPVLYAERRASTMNHMYLNEIR